MEENKNIEIAHLFLSKLESLTAEERIALIKVISLSNNPSHTIATDSLDLGSILNVKAGSVLV